jgi:hypothetical protein
MKPLGAKWLVKLYDHLCSNPAIIGRMTFAPNFLKCERTFAPLITNPFVLRIFIFVIDKSIFLCFIWVVMNVRENQCNIPVLKLSFQKILCRCINAQIHCFNLYVQFGGIVTYTRILDFNVYKKSSVIW